MLCYGNIEVLKYWTWAVNPTIPNNFQSSNIVNYINTLELEFIQQLSRFIGCLIFEMLGTNLFDSFPVSLGILFARRYSQRVVQLSKLFGISIQR